jgi:hypothetical protein
MKLTFKILKGHKIPHVNFFEGLKNCIKFFLSYFTNLLCCPNSELKMSVKIHICKIIHMLHFERVCGMI